VIALTAANSEYCYDVCGQDIETGSGRRAIINSRARASLSCSGLPGAARDSSENGNSFRFTPLNPEDWSSPMRNISRTTIAGLTALSLIGSLVATTEPSAAGGWHGGGWHGGGWHGGGWHGGGWHGGGWHRGGWGGGGWAGPAIVGGLAAGALLAAPYAYGGYGYGGYGCTSYAPIYDAYGNYLGQQLVNGC